MRGIVEVAVVPEPAKDKRSAVAGNAVAELAGGHWIEAQGLVDRALEEGIVWGGVAGVPMPGHCVVDLVHCDWGICFDKVKSGPLRVHEDSRCCDSSNPGGGNGAI